MKNKGVSGIFQISEIGNLFADSAGTKRAMDKWRQKLDSACLKGPEISLHQILIVFSRGITGGKEDMSGIFKIRKSEMFSLITHEPREL